MAAFGVLDGSWDPQNHTKPALSLLHLSDHRPSHIDRTTYHFEMDKSKQHVQNYTA